MGAYDHWTVEELEAMILKYRDSLRRDMDEDKRNLMMPIYIDMVESLRYKRKRIEEIRIRGILDE